MQNLGVILYTNGKERYLSKCYKGLINNNINNIVIVSAGEIENEKNYEKAKIIKCNNLTKSICFNRGLRHFLNDENITDISIIHENIIIIDNTIFTDYEKLSEYTNCKIFCICTEKDDPYGKNNNKRLKLYTKNELYSNLYKASSNLLIYFKKSVVEKIGLFDERYHNFFEITDFYKKGGDFGLCTPLGWVMDSSASEKYYYIQDIAVNDNTKYEDDMLRGMKVFYLKYKTDMEKIINIFSKEDIITKLKNISSRSQ